MRTMLDRPAAYWGVRVLSEITGKAIGTVSNVKSFLKDRAWIEEYPHGFQLRNIKELLTLETVPMAFPVISDNTLTPQQAAGLSNIVRIITDVAADDLEKYCFLSLLAINLFSLPW